MATTLRKIILLLMFFAGNTVAAQVKFVASVNPSEIAKDEYAELRLTIQNGPSKGQINPPPMNNFTIVSGPSQETSTSVINGVASSAVSLVYVIKPKAAGTFSIPSATATIGSSTYRSNPVSIKVNNTLAGNNANSNANSNSLFSSPFGMIDPFADAGPQTLSNDYVLRKGENPAEKVKRNMLVRLEVDKHTCYVGEPIVATYKLYTRLKSESAVTKNPSFNGFSVIDLPVSNGMNYTNERYNGKDYTVCIIRKVQLYPLQSGNLELESAEVDNKIRFIKAEYANRAGANDIFNDFPDAGVPAEGIEDHNVTIQSEPVNIVVKALPEANKPTDFKTAVGTFNITSALEKTNFSTDDAGKLQIVLKGEGNLQLITNVNVQWPEGIDAFEPKTMEDISKLTVPVSGRKIVEYPFTVAKAGQYTIAPITFSFFDPKVNAYKTVKTEPLSFTVTQGTGKPSQDTLNIIDESKDKGVLEKIFKNRKIVVSIVAMLILTGLFIWLKKDNKKVKKEKEDALEKEKLSLAQVAEPVEEIINNQKNQLTEAEACLHDDDCKKFYGILNQSFKNFLSNKLHIPLEELNKKTINEKMDKNGIAIDTSIQVQQLLDEIEWELYTPFSETAKMQQSYDKANELIQLLNTYKI